MPSTTTDRQPSRVDQSLWVEALRAPPPTVWSAAPPRLDRIMERVAGGAARALGRAKPVRDEARRQSPGRASLDSS